MDYAVPEYDLHAGSRTNFMYLKLLVELGIKVQFLPQNFKRIEPYSSELNQLGVELLDGPWFEQHWESWLQENGHGIDYVFFHKPDPAMAFLSAVKRFTNAAIIYQCHELHYLSLRRKAEIEKDEQGVEQARQAEEKEDQLFEASDALLTFSEVESDALRQKLPHKKVFTVPLFFYSSRPSVSSDFEKRKTLLFVGACAHAPNRDAIKWFCDAVLPLIQKEIPEVVFKIIGADPPNEILALQSDHIQVLGRVSEAALLKAYEEARIMVVPLRYGAGVKGKIIESFYHGVPVVTTEVGLEGINVPTLLNRPKNDANAFAAEVIALYRDNRLLKQMSREGSDFIAENFTEDAAADLMVEVLTASKEQAATGLAEAVGAVTAPAPPRLIAFYLPQYHPIPENDEWWGEGFTEWRNVSKAQPLFSNHYQPHVPADLGYYDLRDEETRCAQAELAQQYGIGGFCYYHYWFNGHRLLQRPLEEVLKSGKPDFPFCICWANENWTRRWDGEERQVLMRQDYDEADDRHHIRALLPIIEDPRYIRINGRPILLIYRTENLPDPARTADIWREEARLAGVGEIYLCRVESVGQCDPHDIHFDAAVEFAPDWRNKGPRLSADSPLLGEPSKKLAQICEQNTVHAYADLADTMMAKEIPDYKWFRCATPSWDNWARRSKGANIFVGATPEKYQSWLSYLIENTEGRLFGEERLIFVNAWNEWAEGNHLEPDEKFGHAFLEATQMALTESQAMARSRRVGASDEVRMGQLMCQLVNHQYRVSQLEVQVEGMLNSTSWKATAPIRWTKQQILDLKKRFSNES